MLGGWLKRVFSGNSGNSAVSERPEGVATGPALPSAPTAPDGYSDAPTPISSSDQTQIEQAMQSNSAGWWTPREEGVLTPGSATQGLRAIDADLYGELGKVLDEPDIELPQLPDVAQNVLRLLEKRDVNFVEAAKAAERDPVLTAEILRVVNSAAFRALQRVQRLQQAFPRLGVRRVRAIVVSATMKSIVIRPGSGSQTVGTQLWRCASASAAICSETAQRVGVPEDDAYLAGLLHDIGMMVLLRVLHDYQTKTGKKLTRPIFAAVAERWHEHLGLRLAEAWHLPDPLPDLVASHHKLPAPGDPLEKQKLIVMFSDVVCSMLEYSPYVPYDFFNLPCVQRLGFRESPETLEWLESLPTTIARRLL